jgi:hypothetical protein
MYGGEMLVATFPVLLPNFRILITYQERPGESRLPVKIVVTGPAAAEDIILFQADVARERLSNFH